MTKKPKIFIFQSFYAFFVNWKGLKGQQETVWFSSSLFRSAFFKMKMSQIDT